MYAAIRMIAGFTVMGFTIRSACKGRLKERRLLLRLFAILLSYLSLFLFGMIPIENLFVTFSTPDELFDYYGNSVERKYIMGEESLLMVYVDDKGKEGIEMARRAKNGWKIVALGKRRVYGHNYDGIMVSVYRCMGTEDYYVRISDLTGNVLEITDNRGTTLWYEEVPTSKYGGWWNDYAIDFDETYAINVNGNWIPVGRDYVDSKTAAPTYKVGNNFQSVG